MKRRLIGHLLKGLLVVAPVAITLYICYRLFVWINQPLATFLHNYAPELDLPGVGFVVTVIVAAGILILVGMLSGNLFARHVGDLIDRQFARFPLIKVVHSSLKDLIGAFVGQDKRFDQPVLVEIIPGSDVRMAGFITRKSMEAWGMPGHVAVYLPMAYNVGGQLVLVPKTRVTPASIPSAELMTFVISGGIAGEAKGKSAEAAAMAGLAPEDQRSEEKRG